MPLFTILTLFPEALAPYLASGVLGQARSRCGLDVRLVDFRDWSRNRHRSVDDRPFGGGPGMVLKPEPIVEAIEWVDEHWGRHHKVALCPTGRPFRQPVAAQLARRALSEEPILLLCGRYEGFDERIFGLFDFESLSLGDFVLAGGELPALCVLEACTRLFPGALGDERSARQDSFQPPNGAQGSARDSDSPARSAREEDCPPPRDLGPLDHPHYTRPRVYRGLEVPPVLLGGDHASIEAWRAQQARERTIQRRPELGRPDPGS